MINSLLFGLVALLFIFPHEKLLLLKFLNIISVDKKNSFAVSKLLINTIGIEQLYDSIVINNALISVQAVKIC